MKYKVQIKDTRYNDIWDGAVCNSYEEALAMVAMYRNSDMSYKQLGRFTYTIVGIGE